MPDDAPDAARPQRPSARWYALGVVLIILGCAWFGISLLQQRAALGQQVEALQRITLPAGGHVDLDPGRVFLYYEAPADPADPPLDYATLKPWLNVTRDGAPPDAPVIGVGRPANVEAYRIGARHAYTVATFTAPAPGRYHIAGPLAPDAADARVAVGRIAVTDMMRDWTGVFGGAVAAIVGSVAGVIVLILTLLLRTGQVTRRDD